MRAPIAALALAAALAGCTHAVTTRPVIPAAPAAKSLLKAPKGDFFAAKPGSVWQYEVVAHPSDDPYVDYPGVETVLVQKVDRTSRGTVLSLRAVDTFTNSYRFPTLTIDDNHATLQGVTYWGPAADTPDALTLDFLHFPPKVGEKWNDGDWFGEVTKQESVTVPAGTFDTFKVGVIGTYDQEWTAVGDYWMAPGAGVVKSYINTGVWIFESALIPAGRKPSRAPIGALPKRVR